MAGRRFDHANHFDRTLRIDDIDRAAALAAADGQLDRPGKGNRAVSTVQQHAIGFIVVFAIKARRHQNGVVRGVQLCCAAHHNARRWGDAKRDGGPQQDKINVRQVGNKENAKVRAAGPASLRFDNDVFGVGLADRIKEVLACQDEPFVADEKAGGL